MGLESNVTGTAGKERIPDLPCHQDTGILCFQTVATNTLLSIKTKIEQAMQITGGVRDGRQSSEADFKSCQL